MKKGLLACFVLVSLYCKAQTPLPDSLIISDNSWAFSDSYSYKYALVHKGTVFQIYQVQSKTNSRRGDRISNKKTKKGSVSEDTIAELISAFNDLHYSKLKLSNFDYDTNWLNNNRNSLFGFIKPRYRYWTDLQIQFTKEKLTDPSNYQNALNRLILREGYSELRDGGMSFDVVAYFKGGGRQIYKASENTLGMPWKVDSTKTFNPAIPKLVFEIVPANDGFNKASFGQSGTLMKRLAEQIFYDDCEADLRKLAPLSFKNETDELKKEFEIIGIEEYPYFGRYLEPKTQTFRITLKNKTLQPGIKLQYFISRVNNTLYPRDSLFKDFNEIRDRIQGLGFLMDFLKQDTARKLDICYFDNNAVNAYNIDGFNKNPVSWKQYDDYAKAMGWDKKPRNELNPSDQNSIKTSIYLDCGCNFRLDNKYLEKSIFFELIDEDGNSSIWLLLPDNTPVLWFFEGDKAYKYDSSVFGTDGTSVQFVCKKFKGDGSIIK